jgi:F420-0:gamma-glutamyl ligase
MTDLLVIPIKTRIITADDDMLDVLIEAISNAGEEIRDNDILAMAETPLGTTEGQVVNLSEVEVSPMAQSLAERYDLLPAGRNFPRAPDHQEQHSDGQRRS